MPIVLLDSHLPSSNLPYLFAAFAVCWAVFFVYIFFVTRRQQELRNEISRLRRTVEQEDGDDPAD
jgi:CcmD family protein